MRAYVINIMVVRIIFPVILQTVISVIMLSIGGHVHVSRNSRLIADRLYQSKAILAWNQRNTDAYVSSVALS